MTQWLSGLNFTFIDAAEKSIPAYTQHYDVSMVAVSVLIAVFASFCAFEIASRRSRHWTFLSALMLGLGTWSMHFMGMLALRLDCGMTYNPWITALSSLPGVGAAALAMHIVGGQHISDRKLAFSGAIMGSGIGLMHYSGMAAMGLDGIVRYDFGLFLLSLVCAVIAAVAALKINRWLLMDSSRKPYLASLAGGSVMGLAISSMHYVAMEAAQFIPPQGGPLTQYNSPSGLAWMVGLATVLVLSSGFAYLYINSKVSSARTRMRSIKNLMQQGFVITDATGLILESNPAMLAMLQVRQEEVLGKNLSQWVNGEVKTGGHWQSEVELQRSDGTFLPCEVQGDTFWDADSRQMASFAVFSNISARINAENQAQTQLKQFVELLQAVPDPMIVVDSKGIIIMSNQQAETFYGYARSDMIKHKVEMLMPMGFRADFKAWSQRYLLSPEVLHIGVDHALYARTALGMQVPVEVSLSPLRMKDDLWVVCTAHDITQRLESQRQLRAAISEQNAIFNSASSGIVLLHDQMASRVNQRASEMLGYVPEQLMAKPLHTWFKDPTDFPVFSETAFKQALAGQAYLKAHEFLRGDGSGIWALLSVNAIDVNDPSRGFVLLLTDMTQERQASAQIALANTERAAILDAATTGISFIKNRTFVRTNRRMHEMLGWDLWEMIGQPTSIWYPSPESNLAVLALYQSIWAGESPHIDLQLKRKDDSLFWARLTGNAVDVNDKEQGTVWSIEDISLDREKSEALRQAKEEAEAATISKSEFLSNMSHEIRTPMNAIIGMAHLALKTTLDDKQRNYIERVHQAGTNLLGIINDILDFSKMEAGMLSMEAIDFQLEEVISNMADLIALKTDEKGLEFIFDASADVPVALVGDPLRLGQVLLNLGNNAVKFTNSGEIVLGVKAVAQTQTDVELHFWLKDTGIGMTEEQCKRLFHSFSQADASTTRKYGGTGLGLAICKNIVELMQGRIWVESEPGKGSTFHFHAHFGIQDTDGRPRMFTADELKGISLLIVDDNSSALLILSSMAKSFGMTVDTAESGRLALEKISAAGQAGRPYSLVVTDWQMPEMNGVEMLKQLRSSSPGNLPSVIMVTAYAKDKAVQSIEENLVEVSHVLTKPVTPSSLLESFGVALDRRRMLPQLDINPQTGASAAMLALRGARILLVEDNEMNQELAKELLSDAGMQVILANNGLEALNLLAEDKQFDGILMDCQMPVMDGYTATREIRKIRELDHIPIVAITANTMAGDRELVIEAGMSDHIGKPLNVNAMFITMAKWFKPAGRFDAATYAVDAASKKSTAGRLPSELAGINITLGMANMMKNENLYLRLLLRFRESQDNFKQRFQMALSDADAQAAQRCAHNLKSTAGSVGATQLEAMAASLEAACAQTQTMQALEPLVDQVDAEVRRVVQSLSQLSVGENLEKFSGQVDVQQVRKLQEALLKALGDGDARAVKLWSTNRAVFAHAYPCDWSNMDRALNAFDFETARATFLAVTHPVKYTDTEQ